MSITRYAGNPTFPDGQIGDWNQRQMQEFVIFADPTDATKLVMLFAGMSGPGVQNIGRAIATVAAPFTWTFYASNPVLSDVNRRLDSVVNNIAVDGKLYLYSTNCVSNNKIQLLTSLDYGFTWSAATDVLTAAGQGRTDGDHVSQGAVYKVDSTHWIMVYSYRNGLTVLPGLRYATSADGITWTKAGSGDILSTGAGGSYDSTYIEWHNIIKIGSTYVMSYEAYDGAHWTINIATSPDLIVWTKSTHNPAFSKSDTANAFDQNHVATGAFALIGGTWYLTYQGQKSVDYTDDFWKGGMATLSGTPLDIVNPPAVTPTRNGLTLNLLLDLN